MFDCLAAGQTTRSVVTVCEIINKASKANSNCTVIGQESSHALSTNQMLNFKQS